MTTRETRFVGNGNIWVADGAYRGWQVVCSRCGVPKLTTGHKGSTLPPSVIVKKLTLAGWYIGRKEEDDLCPNCRRNPRKVTTKHEQRPVSTTAQLTSPAAIIGHLQSCLEGAQQSSTLGDSRILVAGALRLLEPLRVSIRSGFEKDRELLQMSQQALTQCLASPLPMPTKAEALARYLGIDWERDDGHKIATACIEKFGLEKTGEIVAEVEALLSKRRENKAEPDAEAEEYEEWLAELDRAHHAQSGEQDIAQDAPKSADKSTSIRPD